MENGSAVRSSDTSHQLTRMQLAITTSASLSLYRVTKDDKLRVDLRQTLYPPSIDINPVSFRAAR